MNSLHSSGILNFFITDFLFGTYKAFFQEILGDVICINLFNNCFNHFRCECESCSTMDTAEERMHLLSSYFGSDHQHGRRWYFLHNRTWHMCCQLSEPTCTTYQHVGVLRKCGTIRWQWTNTRVSSCRIFYIAERLLQWR